jgi:hypothetical protein
MGCHGIINDSFNTAKINKILHRDIKTINMFLTKENKIKIQASSGLSEEEIEVRRDAERPIDTDTELGPAEERVDDDDDDRAEHERDQVGDAGNPSPP